MTITVFTDGSCHTQLTVGAWAAIILVADKKIVLSGAAVDTTHNRMELLAVINALKYIQSNYAATSVHVISDSQYVVGLSARRPKLMAAGFHTKKGNDIANADLVSDLFALSDALPVQFVKIKAHLKKMSDEDYNIEADKLCRSIVRRETERPPG